MKKLARAKKSTTNAVEILRKRYIQGNAEREKSVEDEHLSAEIARMIFELRKESGLSQKHLAELVGTTQSVISRLEDSDYEGHSLPMLERIAKALNRRVAVSMRTPQVREETVHYAFRRFVQNARRKEGLSIKQASKKMDVDSSELEQMEHDSSYRPSPLALSKLSEFYGVSHERLAALAGSIKDLPPELRVRASKFAAQSESFAKLSKDEKKALDEFMRFLKDE